MVGRYGRVATTLLAASSAMLAMIVASVPGRAAAGAGTFTRITTPAHDVLFHLAGSGSGHLRVSGTTSLDVTQVDLDCLRSVAGVRQSSTLLSGVPVSGRSFDALVPVSGPLVPCRLRAVPVGLNPDTAYLGSFSGPILRVAGVVKRLAGGVPVGYQAFTAVGTGFAVAADASQCATEQLATIETPAMDVLGGDLQACAPALPAGNARNTASATQVDGHNAYLPLGVALFLKGFRHLNVAQSSLTVSSRLAPNGDLRVVEAARLRRCAGTNPDTYPPTSSSCTALVDTGVTFQRVLDVLRGAHQLRVRDSFLGTDSHFHSVRLEYFSGTGTLSSGAPGYLVPNHGSTFRTVTPGQRFTGLGTRANTFYVRSDAYASSDEQQADTLGCTWSRAPRQLQIDPVDTRAFELPYALRMAAHGRADLGFAWTDRVATMDTRALASVAQREMVNPPHVSRPRDHAVVKGHSTTVTGFVTLGANGLPNRVTVHGHAAKLRRVSATRATFAVTFRERRGRHVLHVTAVDVAGNTRTATVHVRNR